jgi:hypothetical protein
MDGVINLLFHRNKTKGFLYFLKSENPLLYPESLY